MSAAKFADKLRSAIVQPIEPMFPLYGCAANNGYQEPQRIDATAKVREIRAEMANELRRRADSVMGPEAKKAKRNKAKKLVADEISARVYETPNGARLFAEGVVSGGLGTFITWVYFIGCGTSGPIKIGWSDDPVKRLAALQTGHAEELHLLCSVSGDPETEKMLHGVFAPDHMRGEWFARSPQIIEFVRVVGVGARKPPPPPSRRKGRALGDPYYWERRS